MTNRIFLLLSRFVEKGVMFLFFAIMARHFGQAEFGEFSYYFALAAIIFVLFDNGGELYQMPLIAKYGDSRKLLFRIATTKTFFFMVILSLALIYIPNVKLLYLLLAFYLESLVSLGRSFLFYRGEFIRESIYHTSEKLVLLFLALVAGLWMDHLIFMYLSLTVGKIVYLTLFITRNNIIGKQNNEPTFISIVIGSWSYVLHAGLVAVALQFDVIIMKQMGVPYDQVALYSAAIRLIMAVTVIPQVLFSYYYPDVARCLNAGDHDSLVVVLKRARLIEWTAAIVIMYTIVLTSNEIIFMIYGSGFSDSSVMLSLLAPVILIRFIRYSDSAVLSASEKNKIKLYITISAVLVGIVLNIALIPRYGIYGPIASVFVSDAILWIGFRLSAKTISDAVSSLKVDLMLSIALFLMLFLIIVGMHDMQYARMVLLMFLWSGMAMWFFYRWVYLNRMYKQ